MKILFVTPSVELGGAEIYFLTWAKELKNRGYEVTIVSGGGILVQEFENNGIRHLQREINWRLDINKNPFYLWRGSRELRRILKTYDFDIINTNAVGATLMCYLAMRFPSQQKIPLLAWIPNINKWKFINYDVAGILLNKICDFVITCNQDERRKLIMSKLNPSRIATIYNGVDLRKFSPNQKNTEVKSHYGYTPQTPVIGIIARLSPEKGHTYFLEAASMVLNSFPDARFLLVGSGILETKLKSYVKTLNIEHAVHFTGFRSDISYMLQGIDISVISSIWDTLPNAINEAMAMRKPVISTDVGGIREVVQDGISGILVPPKDPQALAHAITTLLTDPVRREEMGRQGRRIIEENFELHKMIDKVEECYEKVLQKHRYSSGHERLNQR